MGDQDASAAPEHALDSVLENVRSDVRINSAEDVVEKDLHEKDEKLTQEEERDGARRGKERDAQSPSRSTAFEQSTRVAVVCQGGRGVSTADENERWGEGRTLRKERSRVRQSR